VSAVPLLNLDRQSDVNIFIMCCGAVPHLLSKWLQCLYPTT